MEILIWIKHHFMVISMVWFPAFLGYLNAFVASCKVMGWTKLADELGRLENAIKVFVDTARNQNRQTEIKITLPDDLKVIKTSTLTEDTK